MTTIFAALIRRSAAQMRYAVLGSLVLTFVMQLVLVGQAVSIQESQSFANVASLIPNFIGRGLGSEALLLASFKGTVMLGYFHPLLCVLIPAVAMYAATEPAHEVESGLVDLVRGLGRRIHRDGGNQHDEQRVKVPQHDGPLERCHEERQITAESTLDKARKQARHVRERLRLLDRHGLADEDELKRERQHERSQHDVAHLHDGSRHERYEDPIHFGAGSA